MLPKYNNRRTPLHLEGCMRILGYRDMLIVLPFNVTWREWPLEFSFGKKPSCSMGYNQSPSSSLDRHSNKGRNVGALVYVASYSK